MGEMNKVMDPQKMAKTMREFEMQNARMEMTEEMSESTFLQYDIFYPIKGSEFHTFTWIQMMIHYFQNINKYFSLNKISYSWSGNQQILK